MLINLLNGLKSPSLISFMLSKYAPITVSNIPANFGTVGTSPIVKIAIRVVNTGPNALRGLKSEIGAMLSAVNCERKAAVSKTAEAIM